MSSQLVTMPCSIGYLSVSFRPPSLCWPARQAGRQCLRRRSTTCCGRRNAGRPTVGALPAAVAVPPAEVLPPHRSERARTAHRKHKKATRSARSKSFVKSATSCPGVSDEVARRMSREDRRSRAQGRVRGASRAPARRARRARRVPVPPSQDRLGRRAAPARKARPAGDPGVAAARKGAIPVPGRKTRARTAGRRDIDRAPRRRRPIFGGRSEADVHRHRTVTVPTWRTCLTPSARARAKTSRFAAGEHNQQPPAQPRYGRPVVCVGPGSQQERCVAAAPGITPRGGHSPLCKDGVSRPAEMRTCVAAAAFLIGVDR